jgi:ParB family chromosome partitioning protein
MTSILETTPLGTQAAAIDAVCTSKHPRLAIPTVASNYDLPLQQLQVILNSAGYPDVDRMRAHASRLRAQAAAEIAEQPDRPTASDAAEETTGLQRVKVEDIHPDPDNLRENVHGFSPDSSGSHNIDDIEQLADSIRELGLLQPIVVRRAEGGRLIVVAGHRRLAALHRLRWTSVDVIVRPPMRPDHVIAAMLVENGQRRDLDPIEEARGIRKLKTQLDLTDLELARKIGRSQPYVSGRLALLALTPEEQDQVRNGEIGRTEATHLGRLKSGKTRNSTKGHITVQHFGATHDLATQAKARCKRLNHRGPIAGGMACGPCWESVIRASEREALQIANAKADDCVTCGHPIDHQEHTA